MNTKLLNYKKIFIHILFPINNRLNIPFPETNRLQRTKKLDLCMKDVPSHFDIQKGFQNRNNSSSIWEFDCTPAVFSQSIGSYKGLSLKYSERVRSASCLFLGKSSILTNTGSAGSQWIRSL